MKVSRGLAWIFIVLISVLFAYGLNLVVFYSEAEGAADINIIHDSYAETQTYQTFFMVFSEELLRFMEKNRGKIYGRHRVFVLEFYRIIDPTDKMIFIYLDLNMALKEPLLVHRERINKLGDDKSMKAFASKTIKNLIRIIGEKASKKHEI